MDITAYLNRINYHGDRQPTLETLTALHRAHLLAIPYENLDIHLGRTLSLDITQIFDKLVTRHRGGWCYEMNSLLAWALRELGFKVTLLASAVNREISGDAAERNHLILRIDLDRPYLVDVGFGNGFLEPLPLETGEYIRGYLTYQLRHDGERWYFRNHHNGGPGYDFTLEPRQIADFSDRCTELQTSPESGFVRTTVCQRFTPEGIVSFRSLTLKTVNESGATEQVIDTPEAYQGTLENVFDISLPPDDVAILWQKSWDNYQTWVRALNEIGPE